jgi:hypothetical protein
MQLLLTGVEDVADAAHSAYAKTLRVLSESLEVEDAVFFLGGETGIGARAFFEFHQVADAVLFSGQGEGSDLPVLESGILGKPVFCGDSVPMGGLSGVEKFPGEMSVRGLAEWLISRILQSETITARRKILRDYRWQSIYHKHIAPLLKRCPPPYHP